ncbi:alpha/beta fold hydrolase [Thalassotalea euphylliae]|uniref:alpha/beta fold hydrolase n=1 Tax=Thalassotalea euphylliae TaxID=1655234 RepID=UPI00362B9200
MVSIEALKSRYVDVNGVSIHYKESGKADNFDASIIFLHGFPEYWGTWKEQLAYFTGQFHLVAPDLPGYNLSDKPNDNTFYQVPNLVSFFSKFIKKVAQGNRVILVAHDWGGAIAWPLAAFHADLVNKLVILNAAHPSTFTREMFNNVAQRVKSDYIHDLIADDAVERLSANDYSYLGEKIFSTMNPDAVSTELMREYKSVWSIEGAVAGMMGYYRAMPQLAEREPGIKEGSIAANTQPSPEMQAEQAHIPNIRVSQSTLVLWGELDQAFVVETLDGLEHYVTDLTLVRFPNATHWLQHECSAEINQAIDKFIK